MDQFVERYGLIDTKIEYSIAQSGRTVWRSSTMAEMLAVAKAGSFDVLLTGYFDRWQRNLRRTLELVEDDLHPSGVAWVMCDRRLMSSDPRDWDQMVTEAHEAERYSRRLGERITDCYAAKFRRLADPGGHAPLGFLRIPPTCWPSTRTPLMLPCGSLSGMQSVPYRSRRLPTSLVSTIGGSRECSRTRSTTVGWGERASGLQRPGGRPHRCRTGCGSGSRACEPAGLVTAAVVPRPGSTCYAASSTASVVSGSAPTGQWGLHPRSGNSILGTTSAGVGSESESLL
jgi:hypothetical protein